MDPEDPFAIFQQPIKRNRPESKQDDLPRKMVKTDPIE